MDKCLVKAFDISPFLQSLQSGSIYNTHKLNSTGDLLRMLKFMSWFIVLTCEQKENIENLDKNL